MKQLIICYVEMSNWIHVLISEAYKDNHHASERIDI